MANYQLSCTHEDLVPSVTSALGAAYDSVLQTLELEEYALLRYALARHLMSAAFAGERDPDLLRQRAIAFVTKSFNQRRPSDMKNKDCRRATLHAML